MEGLHLQEETLYSSRIYIRSCQVVQEGWDFCGLDTSGYVLNDKVKAL